MLSSVLNSERAILINIAIIRAFVKLRELMISHKDLAKKIEDLEDKFGSKLKKQDQKFAVVFKTIRQLLEAPEDPFSSKPGIGSHVK